jgi:hypothetical protein
MAGVRDIDRGWRKYKEMARKLDDAHVDVGLFSDAAPYARGQEGAATVAQIGTFHEFGYGVPERPFMRPTMDSKQGEYAELMQRLAVGISDGKIEVAQALGLLGAKATADVRQTISEMTEPPLAQSTIDAKGSSALLIDTGHMWQSLTWCVSVEGAIAGDGGIGGAGGPWTPTSGPDGDGGSE